MRIGVLGTGTVGRTLASAFVANGHHVTVGSRMAGNEAAVSWAAGEPPARARAGTFADAAAGGEVLVNATAGVGSVAALEACAVADLAGKVLLDVANPLDFSTGQLRLTVANDDSLAETIQRTYPELRVVKALNTLTASVMVDPASLPGDHVVFLAGDQEPAKEVVRELLADLGWRPAQMVDLGGLSAARGMEMYLPLWVATMQALGTATFNLALCRPGPAPVGSVPTPSEE